MALDVMDRDAKKTRGSKPFVFTNLKTGRGLDTIINHIEIEGHLCASLAMTVFLPANTATAHDGHGAAAGHLHWLDYGPAVRFILVAAACIARRKFLPR